MRKMKLFLVALSFTLFYSCNSDKSGKFVGTWKSLKSSSTFTISKVGQNFSVSNDRGTYPASYNKENDKLELKAGFNQFDIIYDPKTKHLIVDGEEVERVNQ